MKRDWTGSGGRRAKELAERSSEPSSELREVHVSSCDTEVLEEGSRGYAEALGVYRASDIMGEVEAAGGVLLGVQRDRVMDNPWLTSVVFSMIGGRAKLCLTPIDPMTRGALEGTSGGYDLNFMFISVYESGEADLTWGRPTIMTPSTLQLGSWPGSGDFREDLSAHRRRVEARDEAAFLHEDMEDAQASMWFYESQLVPDAMLAYIYTGGWGGGVSGDEKKSRWPIVAGVLAALLVWWIWSGLSLHGI